ncbi:MAG TPA: class II aldolase/adducin family protein [Planctomycetota bacterium]|nr:class II aldolase/adducin family protein [Planctomycetota bacterium]
MTADDAVSEAGVRTRFAVRRLAEPPVRYPEHDALVRWCEIFDAEGLAPVEGGASAGNLSFRTPRGYVITPTRSRLKRGLVWTDFPEVAGEDLEAFALDVLGPATPSSDAFLHGRIYARRPDVGAVFHGHDPLVLRHADRIAQAFGAPTTPEARLFGTRRDAEETAAALGEAGYVVRRGHGFVATGRTPDEAGALALAVRRFVVELG